MSSMSRQKKKILKADQLGHFCAKMEMLLQSGVSIHDGLAAEIRLKKQLLSAPGDQAEELTEAIFLGLESGLSLCSAMESTGVFPANCINIVMIGENSGALDEVFHSLAASYRRQAELIEQIRSALVWPIFTLCMMAVILQILTRKVFPIFTGIYESLGSGLSSAARASIAVGGIFADLLTALALLILITGLVILLLRQTALREKLSVLPGRLPILRAIIGRLTAARIAEELAMMLDAGYDADESLHMIGGTIKALCPQIEAARKKMHGEEPLPLSEALCGLSVWNETEKQLIRTGAHLGDLDRALRYIAQSGTEEAEVRINRAVSLIEPIMITLTAILIGSILLSVMLPLSGIMAAIG